MGDYNRKNFKEEKDSRKGGGKEKKKQRL